MNETAVESRFVCLVLAYHEVAPTRTGMRSSLVVTPQNLRRQLLWLRTRGYKWTRLGDLRKGLDGELRLPKRSFAITFDDGYTGICQYALPVLSSLGVTATVFVVSGELGETEPREPDFPKAKMTPAQLKELIGEEWTIGAHTRSHLDLANIPLETLEDEVRGAREDLEAILQVPVDTFAYPFGSYSTRVLEAVRSANYRLACTTEYGVVRPGQDPYVLPRVLIGHNLSLPRFVYRTWRAQQMRMREAAS